MAVSIYPGSTVLGLAMLALGWRRRREFALLALCSLGFLTAMGSYTPVHRIVRWLLPPLAFMRFPEKYLVVPMMVLTLLAALGAERLLQDAAQGVRRTRATIAILIVLLLVDALSWIVLPGSLRESFLVGCVHGIVALLGLLALQTQGSRWPRAVALSLPLLVTLDTAGATLGILKFDADEKLTTAPPLANAIWQDYSKSKPGDVPPRLFRSFLVSEVVAMRQPRIGAMTSWRAVLTLRENLGSTFGIATVPGYDAALAPELDKMFKASRPESMVLAGAQFALLPIFQDSSENDGHLRPLLDPLPGARLYSLSNALPRVYAVTDVRVGRESLTDAGLFHPDVVAGRAATIPVGAKNTIAMSHRDSSAGNCHVSRYLTDSVSVDCDLKAAALVVLVEQFCLGWKAKVDGVVVPVLRANTLARGVVVGAGKHKVDYHFEPHGVLFGVVVSATTLIVLLFSAGLNLWIRKENGSR